MRGISFVAMKSFWDRALEVEGGCWEWQGARSHSGTGYGQVRVGLKILSAHRVAWELATGRPIPTGLFICHSCDNRSCINPSHLFLGTRSDNMKDAYAKGRIAMPSPWPAMAPTTAATPSSFAPEPRSTHGLPVPASPVTPNGRGR